MQASQNALDLIRHFEGLRLSSYADAKGVWTIGWGHTGDDVHPGMTIDSAEAQRLLDNDVDFAVSQLNRMITREPNLQHHFDAMLSLVFNIGAERFRKSTLLKFYNFSQDKEAANEFMRWNKVKIYGKLTPFRGLTNRRQTERTLYITGKLIF